MGVEQFNMDNINEADAQLRHRKNNKNDSCLENSQKVYFEYCSMTSVHGFQYFGSGRTRIEVIFWSIMLLLSFTGCAYMIYEIYVKWDESPVIVSFANKNTPIYDIPFPAVTVCPSAQISSECIKFSQALEQTYENLSKDEKKYMQYYPSVCEETMYDTNDLKEEYLVEKEDPSGIYNFFEQCKTSIADTTTVTLLGKIYNFTDLFVPVLTDSGLCYTSNILDRNEIYKDVVKQYDDNHAVKKKAQWSMEEGYTTTEVDTYPRRALLSGLKRSMDLLLITLKDDIDYGCQPVQGFWVVLHSPSRIPRPSEEGVMVTQNYMTALTVKPSFIYTNRQVKRYKPHKRDCYFNGEKFLKYFDAYSSVNCQMECLTNKTLTTCGCVSYFMPHEAGTRICGVADLNCTNKVEELLKYPDEALIRGDNDMINNCDCIPQCTDITYNTAVASSALNWTQVQKTYGWNANHTSVAMISIYFKSNSFTSTERNELYGPSDFVSNIGGILGLFTGFSILSFMEILYFMSLRPYGNQKIFGHWAGNAEE